MTQRMNPEVKSKWVARLRSGEYAQGSGYLNQANGNGGREYCCLGVLCEIAREEGVIPDPKEAGDILDYGGISPEELSVPQPRFGMQFPPPEVVKWAGLSEYDPHIEYEHDLYEETIEGTLSELNDEGRTFDEIADLIEKQL